MRSDLYFTIMDTKYCYYRNSCPDCDTEVCTYQCKRLEQTKYLLDLSNLPLKYRRPQNLNMELLNKEAYDYVAYLEPNIDYFVKQGYNAYFYGNTGVGKTSWAVKMLTTYFCNVSIHNNFAVRGLFISVPSFLRDIKLNITYKDENFKELLDTLKTCDLVIWDDVFQTDATQFESQWLYSYMNERIMNGKANIFTSNLSFDMLANCDKRLYSRICTISDEIYFECSDMRMFNRFGIDIAEAEAENSEEENELNNSENY